MIAGVLRRPADTALGTDHRWVSRALHTDRLAAGVTRLAEAMTDTAGDPVVAALCALRETLGADLVMVADWRDGEMVPHSVVGDAESFGMRAGTGIPLAATLCNRLLVETPAAVVCDVRADDRLRTLALVEDVDVGAYAGVQVRLADGTRLGSLCAISHGRDESLGETHLGFMQVVARVVADRLERERRAEPAQVARLDALTGLPNRAALAECFPGAIAQARRAHGALALLYLDLDDFKLVNDGLGHAAGDALLCQVADRLRRVLRASDLLVRQGGDEFVILLAPILAGGNEDLEGTARQAAAACAERVAAELERPFTIGEAELQVDASVGVSLYPFDAKDGETLHKYADAAMYAAKGAGGGYETYRRDTADPLARLALAARLRRGLEHNEFELHYQPIWRMPERSIVGVEALMRWRSPEHGLVSPAEFIPLAERTGVIDALGEWALRELCRQARAWLAEGLAPNFGLNVSPRQLRRPGFGTRVRRTIDEHELDSRRFVLELTESSWTVDGSRTLPLIAELRASGLAVALDDFGAGYSSLSRLRQLPVGVIKIDRAFMQGIPEDAQAAATVNAIFQLAEACGCDVVAEGVETEAQLRFLVDRGCRLLQGFHLARPLPVADITPLLHTHLLPARRVSRT